MLKIIQMEEPDFKIDLDGYWYHDGARINRARLAKLFSDRALSIDEEGCYWLKTPFEQYPVAVEDVPFVITDYEKTSGGLDFITNMQETVPLGPDHVLELRGHVPYIEVRDGLYARVGRSVYYNLIEEYGETIESRGIKHILGVMDE